MVVGNRTGKVDGSLIVAYCWHGEWRFNTRGSFGDVRCGNSGKSWSELVSEVLPEDLGDLVMGCTYVFEFCSPWNQVVAYHPKPKLYLLDVVYPKIGRSCLDSSASAVAEEIGVDRPQTFSLTNADDCAEILKGDKFGPTFEGFVAKDKHGNRVKIKSPRYVALHHLVDNGNIYLERRLVPLILAGETAEVISYFPDLKDRIREVEAVIDAAVDSAVEAWENADFTGQKSFALSVKSNKLSGLLFTAKKVGKHPRELVRDMGDYITKCLFGG